MGCGTSAELVEAVVTSTTNEPAKPGFKEILRKTWGAAMAMIGSSEVGREIFYRMLMESAQIRQIFNMALVPDDQLKKNEHFQNHGDKLGESLKKLVADFTNNEAQFRQCSQTIAKIHFDKPGKKGFNPVHWSIIPKILGEVMSAYTEKLKHTGAPWYKSEECKEAWTKFGDIFIDILQETYVKLNSRK